VDAGELKGMAMKGSVAKLFILVFLLSIVAGIVILIVRPIVGGTAGSGQEERRGIRPEKLSATILAPTPSEPIPQGKNALWCATFQLAWDRLKNDVVKAPIVVEGSEPLCAALNGSPIAEADLPDGAYYAAAGSGPETLAKIRTEMAKMAPNFVPDVKETNAEMIAYAWLKAGVKFDPPYFDAREQLEFQDGSGKSNWVNVFGIRAEDEYAYRPLRARIEIAYVQQKNHREIQEMVIDPCRDSAPNQILLAMIPRKATLKEAWEHTRSRLLPDGHELGPNDTMLIPNVLCSIVQDFDALTGRPLKLPGGAKLQLDIARQGIEFRLNRGGAELGSEAKVLALPVPTHYHFNRPFLIAMRKRGAANPFFLMWVDNAEVLK
jgi:hypothetical protein